MKQTTRVRARLAAVGVTLVLGLTACSGGKAPGSSASQDVGTPDEATEAPALTEMVKAGSLPELEKRLPETPMQVKPLVSEGQYGGTLHRAQLNADDTGALQSFAGAGLMEWDWDNKESVPSLAEKVEVNEDNTVFEFTLRKGLRWSDGEPFTSADLMFALDDYLGNKETIPLPPFWYSDGGELPAAEMVDEQTVKITFKEPFALFTKYMAHPAVNSQFIKPAHYLKQFHPSHTDPDKLAKEAKDAGFENWTQLFADRDNAWLNPDRPVLGAYRVVSPASSQTGLAELERNPYYWKVDPSGRQLPYIDKIQVQVLAQESIDLRASNGDLDFQARFLGYATTQVYQKNAEDRGFKVLRWAPVDSTLAMNFNLSHKDETLRKLFLNKDFRAAFSMAINREAMNETLLGGLGVVEHPGSPEGDPYYVEGYGQNNIQHDAEQANKLLDGIGLTKKDAKGIRTMENGKPLSIVLSYVEDTASIPRSDAFNMVKKDLAAVGIELVLRPVDGSFYAELRGGNDFDMSGTTVTSADWDLEPVWYVPTAANSHSAPGYGAWYASNGKEGMEPPAEIKELMDQWDALRSASSDEDRIAAGKKIMEIHNEQTYIVGLLRTPFQPVVVKDNLVNVRDDQPVLSFYHGREGITKPEQLYFNEPKK